MEHELKLLELLGLKLKAVSDISCNILDKNNYMVGTIQRKQIRRKNNQRRLPAVYGYVTSIKKGSLIIDMENQIKSEKESVEDNHYYKIDFIENEEKTHVEFNLGKDNYLSIRSSIYGLLDFHINDKELSFTYENANNRVLKDEKLAIKLGKLSSYAYTVNFCKKRYSLDELRHLRTYMLRSDVVNSSVRNPLTLTERYFRAGRMLEKHEIVANNELFDLIAKNEIALSSFANFRNIVNEIFGSNCDILSAMMEDINLPPELEIFFDYAKREEKTLVKRP